MNPKIKILEITHKVLHINFNLFKQYRKYIQWVPGALSLGVKLTTHLHLVPNVRMWGAIATIPQYVLRV